MTAPIKPEKKKVDSKRAWTETRALMAEHKRSLTIGFSLMIVNRLAGLVLPASSKFLIDDVIGKHRADMLLPLALLAGEVAPRLESLTITGALWPQQLSDLSVSALLRGLDRLELTAEAETGWYTTLLETIEAWAHLEHLVLTADRHHPEWVQAVKAALPQAVVRDPRLRL